MKNPELDTKDPTQDTIIEQGQELFQSLNLGPNPKVNDLVYALFGGPDTMSQSQTDIAETIISFVSQANALDPNDTSAHLEQYNTFVQQISTLSSQYQEQEHIVNIEKMTEIVEKLPQKAIDQAQAFVSVAPVSLTPAIVTAQTGPSVDSFDLKDLGDVLSDSEN